MANNQINEEYVQKGYLKTYLANRGIKVISYDEWEHLCDCIDDAKAADVRENVHGEWIDDYDPVKFGEFRYKCSKCGARTVEWADNFCYQCGSDMRGGEDD